MFTKEENSIISKALEIIESKVNKNIQVTDQKVAKQYSIMKLAGLEHEVFGVMFLDTQNKIISFEILFRGTIDGASVYPREVAKEALKLNSAAVILTHNHPGGSIKPSLADIKITDKISNALELLDIKVLDHILVGGSEAVSFKALGYL